MAETESRPGHEHFQEEDWLDFARQVGDLEHRARVARHLETGCPQCEQTFRLWSAVLSVADQETAAQPPESAVREMRGRFALQRPKRLRERLATSVALVFDSLRQPRAAGLRATGTTARQLLYKAGRARRDAVRVRGHAREPVDRALSSARRRCAAPRSSISGGALTHRLVGVRDPP